MPDARDPHRILSLCSSPIAGAQTLAREKALTDEWRRTHRTEPKTLPVAVGEEKFVTTTIPRVLKYLTHQPAIGRD